MEIKIDERMKELETQLFESRQNILLQRQQLLAEFINYAQGKYVEFGKPLFIKYTLLNYSEQIQYADLEFNQKYTIQITSFSYIPQTKEIIDYSTLTQEGEKKDADFVANMELIGSQLIRRKYQKTILSKLSDLDQKQVAIENRKKVEHILSGIFKGHLVFEDDEYKRLVRTNIAISKELQRLNKRIEALTQPGSLNGGTDKVKKKTSSN